MALCMSFGDDHWSGTYSVDLGTKPSELFDFPLNFYHENKLLSNSSTWIEQGVKNKSILRVEESEEYDSHPCAIISIFNDGRVQVKCTGGFLEKGASKYLF